MKNRKQERMVRRTVTVLILVALIAGIILIVTSCIKRSSSDSSKKHQSPEPSQNTSTEKPTEPKQTAVPVYGLVPYLEWKTAETQNPDYFKEAVFIGDSVGLKLMQYDGIPGAKYLCYGNYGTTNALDESTAKDNGWPAKIWEEIKGRKRVYIMLGMNDLNRVGVDGAVENMEKLCKLIEDNNPGVLIYIESMTPIIGSKDGTRGKVLNNAGIKFYNAGLEEMAKKNNWYFVDVASVMYNDAGNLKDEYCSDPGNMGLHFSTKGVEVWIDYLQNHCADPEWPQNQEFVTE